MTLKNNLYRHYAAAILGTAIGQAALGDTMHRYKDPLVYGDYVQEVRPWFEKSLKRYDWTLSQDASGGYIASIEHRTYTMRVNLIQENKSVRIELVSAINTGCTSDCKPVKEDKVAGYLVRLRRALALDLTYFVRDATLSSLAN